MCMESVSQNNGQTKKAKKKENTTTTSNNNNNRNGVNKESLKEEKDRPVFLYLSYFFFSVWVWRTAATQSIKMPDDAYVKWETIMCIGWNSFSCDWETIHTYTIESCECVSFVRESGRKKEIHKDNVCKCRYLSNGKTKTKKMKGWNESGWLESQWICVCEQKDITCLGKHVWITAITHSPHHYINICRPIYASFCGWILRLLILSTIIFDA